MDCEDDDRWQFDKEEPEASDLIDLRRLAAALVISGALPMLKELHIRTYQAKSSLIPIVNWTLAGHPEALPSLRHLHLVMRDEEELMEEDLQATVFMVEARAAVQPHLKWISIDAEPVGGYTFSGCGGKWIERGVVA